MSNSCLQTYSPHSFQLPSQQDSQPASLQKKHAKFLKCSFQRTSVQSTDTFSLFISVAKSTKTIAYKKGHVKFPKWSFQTTTVKVQSTGIFTSSFQLPSRQKQQPTKKNMPNSLNGLFKQLL